MKRYSGLIWPDGSSFDFCNSKESIPPMADSMYTASYARSSKSPKEALTEAINSLPENAIIMSSGSLLDHHVARLAGQLRKARIVRIATASLSVAEVENWAKAHRAKYFLVDPNFSAVLYKAEQLIKAGYTVATVGPIPQIRDLAWSTSKMYPSGKLLMKEAQWTIAEHGKCGSAERFAALNPKFIPMLALPAFIPFLKKLDLLDNSKMFRELDVKTIGAHTFARHLKDGQFENQAGGGPLSPAQAKQINRILLTRSGMANYSYTRVERYVGGS